MVLVLETVWGKVTPTTVTRRQRKGYRETWQDKAL